MRRNTLSCKETLIMALLKMLAAGAAGYGLWTVYRNNQAAQLQPAGGAFAGGEAVPGFAPVRNAGPDAMKSDEAYNWDKLDQELDESFPASDPPPMGKR